MSDQAPVRLPEERIAEIGQRLERLSVRGLVIDDHIVSEGDTPKRFHVFDKFEDDPPMVTNFSTADDAMFFACSPQDIRDLLSDRAAILRELEEKKDHLDIANRALMQERSTASAVTHEQDRLREALTAIRDETLKVETGQTWRGQAVKRIWDVAEAALASLSRPEQESPK